MERVRLFRVFMNPEAILTVGKTLLSGFTGQGPRVEEFEERLMILLQTPRRPLTTCSCTAALDLAYHLVGAGPGKTIVTTPQTCCATNNPAAVRGAGIVWADVDPVTGLIDPRSVAERAREDTVAVVAVDWGGRLCDYEALRKVGLPVIRDAAHSILAGRGTHTGDYNCWSFQAIKHLNCGGDGGCILVPEDQYERARLLRWYGLDRTKGSSFRCSQNIEEIGMKSHMNDVAASIGIANLAKVADVVMAHRQNAAWYDEHLAEHSPRFRKPPFCVDCDWWIYTALVDDQAGFIRFLDERGIEGSPVHSRNDRHPGFRRVEVDPAPLPGLDEFSSHEVAIPVGWWLIPEDRERVRKAVEEWVAR
jgi:perosamine synthetase